MKNSQQKVLFILTGVVIFVGIIAYLFSAGIVELQFGSKQVLNKNIGNEEAYQRDIEALQSVAPNFGAISEYFSELAKREGGAYAFEILKRAPVPPNTDIHLVGHVIGDEMFKQEGLNGMRYCTPDFRNACSHTIVIGALLQDGLGVFDEVNEVCKKAPGGPGAYTMCFHGFGHGVLAYTDYELPEAIELCERVGTEEYNNNEFHQCVGGMIMEMRDGIHDPEVWAENSVKYIDPEDPLKPCQASYMPDEAKYFCYTYITPFIFDAAGADPESPTPDDFEKAFAFCADEPDEEYRRICYAGFGKEFIVLAQSRDVRVIDQTADEQLETVISWCSLAKDPLGTKACLLEVQNSLYWGGENDFEVSIRYCSLMPDQTTQSDCFNHFFNNVSFYERSEQTKELICDSVPDAQAKACRTKLFE